MLRRHSVDIDDFDSIEDYEDYWQSRYDEEIDRIVDEIRLGERDRFGRRISDAP